MSRRPPTSLARLRNQAESPVLTCPTCKQHTQHLEADVVVPFNRLDNLKAWRIGISVNTFRFNARLDAEMLKAALEDLFAMDGWKKLGGRIRKSNDVSVLA